jgi:hypothetical protein
VPLGKDSVDLAVTRGTGSPIVGVPAGNVAVGTDKGCSVSTLLVASQQEPDPIVCVAIQSVSGDIRLSAEMIRMASAAPLRII